MYTLLQLQIQGHTIRDGYCKCTIFNSSLYYYACSGNTVLATKLLWPTWFPHSKIKCLVYTSKRVLCESCSLNQNGISMAVCTTRSRLP